MGLLESKLRRLERELANFSASEKAILKQEKLAQAYIEGGTMTKNTSKLSDQDQKKLVMFRIASSGDEGVRPVDLEIDPPFRMTARDCRITLERLLLDDKIYLNDRFRLVTKGLGSEKAPAHQTRYVAGDYRIYVTRDNDGFYSAIVREFPELQARCFFRTHVSKDMLRVLQSKLDELYKNGEDVPTPVSKRL